MAGRPISNRRLVVGMVCLTLLAWATQVLFSQWAHGAEEKFVPAADWPRSALVEIQSEATVNGAEVKLRQVARWSNADRAALDVAGDLVIARFKADETSRVVELADVKSSLESAGVNLSAVSFYGASACKVTRNDPRAVEPPAAKVDVTARSPAAGGSTPIAPRAPSVGRTLRQLVLDDLCRRFNLPADAFQVTFSAQDEKLANLAEPYFQFQLEPRRQRDIGDMTWDVTITADGAEQKATINPRVQAWRNLLVAARPLAFKQVFREEDLVERRVLVDRLGDEMPLSKDQVVAQQAARDISAGMTVTNHMVEALRMVRLGELVTVIVTQGRVQVRWVAEARENGAYGQTIRVRKPNTREEYSVVVTGSQQAKLVGPAGELARQ